MTISVQIIDGNIQLETDLQEEFDKVTQANALLQNINTNTFRSLAQIDIVKEITEGQFVVLNNKEDTTHTKLEEIKTLLNSSVPPPPVRHLDIYLSGLQTVAELTAAVNNANTPWPYGLGVEVRSVALLKSMLEETKRLNRRMVVSVSDGMESDAGINFLANDPLMEWVDELHVEQDRGNHSNLPPVWTNARWVALRDAMVASGRADILHSYRTMWDKPTEYPDTLSWPSRGSAEYPRYDDSKPPWRTDPRESYLDGSFYATQVISNFIASGTNRKGFMFMQWYGQPLTNTALSINRRGMTEVSQTDIAFMLLACKEYGISKVALYPGRIGRGQNSSTVDYPWNMGITDLDAKRVEARFKQTLTTIKSIKEGRMPFIRPPITQSPKITGTAGN